MQIKLILTHFQNNQYDKQASKKLKNRKRKKAHKISTQLEIASFLVKVLKKLTILIRRINKNKVLIKLPQHKVQ
jgi:hypothetical protein